IPIRFKPLAAQSYTGYKLRIVYDNGVMDQAQAIKTVELPLSGTGSDLNTVTQNPSSITFTTAYALNPSSPEVRSVTLTARGHSAFAPVTVTWPAEGKGPFDVSANNCSNAQNASAPTATTCTISFSYKPGAWGTLSRVVQLSTLNPIAGAGTLSLNLTGTASQKFPTLTLSSSSLVFDQRIINSEPPQTQVKTVTITNTANALTGGVAKNFTFSAPSNAAYSIDTAQTTCGSSELPPSAGSSSSCVVAVRFAPSVVIPAPGSSSITLNYQDGNGNSSGPAPALNLSLNLALQGSSTIQDPNLVFSPSPLAFGSKILSPGVPIEPASLELTITNPSTNVINAKNISFSGLSEPYSIDSSGTTCNPALVLSPGQNCKVKVNFSPGVLGSFSQSLAIGYMDGGIPQNGFTKNLPVTGSVVRPLRVFAGGLKTCLITELEEAICFGSNVKGELGQNQSYSFSDLVVQNMPKINFGSGAKVRKIAPGRNHVCALIDYPAAVPSRAGEVACWGDNQYGQLGRGNTSQLNAPQLSGNSIVPVDLGSQGNTQLKAIDLSAGFEHSCAILEGGSIKCWGSNTAGQLGTATSGNLGDASNEMGNALPVVPVPGGAAVSISAGSSHTCVVFNNGVARCWGDNFYGQIGQPNMDNYGRALVASNPKIGPMASLPELSLGSGFQVAEIAASFGARTCARSQSGALKCFGKTAVENTISSTNSFAGLLGKCYMRNSDGAGLFDCNGQNLPAIDVGGKTGDMPSLTPINLGSGVQVSKVISGLTFTCALLNDKSIKCFGKGNLGQLGRDATFLSDVPFGPNEMPPAASVTATANEWPVDLAAGDNHACYTNNLNQLKCFGSATSNATGTRKLPGQANVIQINSAATAPVVYQAQ
ncbi:MAG: choice-of-anchor D domain-containing protein, partial [Bdellovibrionales bacterium]|nr:choice-of-anchor D domain-containing protein [Bdellovibrionales bacterium]